MGRDPRGDNAHRIRHAYSSSTLVISKTANTGNSFGGPIVTACVGEEGQPFHVHEQRLCDRSPFFTKAFQKEWKEGQERTIPLPDDDPGVFDLYVQWIYRGQIFSRMPRAEFRLLDREMELLIDAYIFGEKIQDSNYQDAVLDSLLAYTNTRDEKGVRWFPTGALVRKAYQKTPASSPLRRLLVDMHNRSGHKEWVGDDNNSVEFLADLVREMYATRTQPQSPDPTGVGENSCSYHHHGNDRACYSSSTPSAGSG